MNKKLIVGLIMVLLVIYAIYLLQDAKTTQELVQTSGAKPSFGNDEKSVNAYTSPIGIDYLRSLPIDSNKPEIIETLQSGSNYKRYIVSYKSDGLNIYALLTVPTSETPQSGFPAIVFNHGYIPPSQYSTTEKYIAYVDSLARNGFVVMKIDMRGHGKSEGVPTGSYFSPAYTIDAISALKSLQKLDYVNPNRIGFWGHSMAGNLVLRAMEVSDDVKAGVIWGGAVYSYEDYLKYRISDGSYIRRPEPSQAPGQEAEESKDLKIPSYRENSVEVQGLRSGKEVDFENEFWTSISLTKNLKYLKAPIQLHHSKNDNVVNVGYSTDLAEALKSANKKYELNLYEGGGHNIESPYFESAMSKTIEFFKKNL